MKYLVSFLLLFCGLSAFSQADTIFVLGAEFGATTEPTDSTFTVDIVHPTDQLGQAFTASKIQVGYRLIDVFGRLYRVKSVDATGIGSSTLTVVELQDAAGPSGTGLVYRKPDNSDCIPEIQTGDIGISYALAARIANHNAVVGCGSTGGGGSGTVETVVAGTEINIDATDPANPIVTNTAPDQVVSFTNVGSAAITGTYPNFTVTGTGVTGSLTTNTIPIASGSSTLTNSRITQPSASKTIISHNTTSPFFSTTFDMVGASATVLNQRAGDLGNFATLTQVSGTGVVNDFASNSSSTGGYSSANSSTFLRFNSTTGGLSLASLKVRAAGAAAGAFTDVFNVSATGKIGFGVGGTNPRYTLQVYGDDGIGVGGGSTATRPVGEFGLFRGNTGGWYDTHLGTSFGRIYPSSDVTPTSGQIPVWNSTTGLYEPVTATPAQTPAPSSTADSIGNAGDIRYDDDYIYVKTSAGWKRSALSTF